MRRISILFTAAAVLTAVSCIKDDRLNNMVPDSLTMTATSHLISASVHTGGCEVGISKSGVGLSAATVTISTEGAAEALSAYNTANDTLFVAVPESYYTIEDNTLRFEASDAIKTAKISWDIERMVDYMGDDTDKVIALTIRSGDLEVNGENNFVLINLNRSTFALKQTTRAFSYDDAFFNPEDPAAAKPEPVEDISLDLESSAAIKGVAISVPVKAEESLVSVYNSAHPELETPYTAAPDGMFTILTENVEIPEGGTGAQLKVRFDRSLLLNSSGHLTEFAPLMYPVKLDFAAAKASKGGESFELKGAKFGNDVAYIIVRYAANGISDISVEWGKYSSGGAWYNYLTGFADGCDRSIAMDNKYIYVAHHSGGSPAVYALDITNGDFVKTLDTGSAASNGCTHPVSCVRSINRASGDPVILFSSLKGDGDQHLYVYAYRNGTDAAPVLLLDYLHDNAGGADDWRRYGDRFTVEGTWEDGTLWFNSWSSGGANKTIGFKLSNGTVTNPTDPVDYCVNEPTTGIREFVIYPGKTDYLMLSRVYNEETPGSLHTNIYTAGEANGNGWTVMDPLKADGYPDLDYAFGFNFFKVHGKEYVCYAQSPGPNAMRGKLIVAESPGSLEKLSEHIDKCYTDDNLLYYESPLQSEDDFDVYSALSAASSVTDCTVRSISGTTFIATLLQGGGLKLFRVQ